MIITQRMKDGQKRISEAYANKPGRVPVMAQLASHTLGLTKVDPTRFWTDPEVFISSHLLASEYYSLDIPSTYYDVYNIEAEALGQPLVYPKGEFPEIDQSRLLLSDPEALNRLRPPRPDQDGRMPFVTRTYQILAEMGLSPAIRFCAPFSLAANVRGLSNLIMDILLRPQFAHDLLAFLVDEVLAPYLEHIRKACGTQLPAMGADALASPPITNPDIVEQFALAYIQRLDERIGKVNVFGWWGDSHGTEPENMFKLKLRACPGLFYCLDPDLNKIGPSKVAAYAADHGRALIMGLDCSLLGNGPREEIIARTKDYVSMGGAGYGRVLFLNAVPTGAPAEHVHAAIQAARFYSENRDDPDMKMVYQPRPSFEEWMESEGRGLV